MANAIDQTRSGLTIGRVALGRRGDGPGTVAQLVSDGDTLSTWAPDNLPVRLLGVDAPETRVSVGGRFVSLESEEARRLYADPFADRLAPFDPPLQGALREDLERRAGPDAATNQRRHGEAAERALEAEVAGDVEAAGSPAAFRFFLAFAAEVFDRYGRLLCYVDRQRDRDAPRGLTYNERLLQRGLVVPYFIWPNVNPFRRQASRVDSVPEPGSLPAVVAGESSLRRAREWVQAARGRQIGLWEAEGPLALQPFEVRFLADRRAPERWVVDLTSDGRELVPPQSYVRIARAEDRLYVPAEYVPLWVERGWRRGGGRGA